jgi:uracil-DNA glycosylase
MLNNDWKVFLKDEFEKEYFWKINKSLTDKTKQGEIIYPPKDDIFRCFNLVPINNIKVVIIGQDPYHRDNQANGLSFSVNRGISIPPSLKNIFTEIKNDLGLDNPLHGDLTSWANQGVLLMNSFLTVTKSSPGSHKDIGWNIFTDNVISKLSELKENLVFILWGKFAQSKYHLIDESKHLILMSAHPSPYSVSMFYGNKHFSKCNEYLKNHGIDEINWNIDA